MWTSLLDAFTTDAGSFNNDDDHGAVASLTPHPPCQARFQVRVGGAQTWFEVTFPRCTDVGVRDVNAGAPGHGAASRGTGPTSIAVVSVKGEHVSRDAHERWNAEIDARMAGLDEECAFPAYELLSQLIAILHRSQDASSSPPPTATTSSSPGTVTVTAAAHVSAPELPYHALLTSHHLISATKRRTLHHLSSRLGIAGFAKVGYPGIIYAEGPRESVEAFVREIKGMQWLALRVRFVDPVVPVDSGPGRSVGLGFSGGRRDDGAERGARWVEVSKVAEVLALMRMRGREGLVTNLGIGAPSKERPRQ